jgi:hypothetical protein
VYHHDTGAVAINLDVRYTCPTDSALPDTANPLDFSNHASVT